MYVVLHNVKWPTITTELLPEATQGTEYSYTLEASGEDITWTIDKWNGNLPLGLSLDQSGTISGTPIEGRLFSFCVSVSNEYESLIKLFTLTVKADYVINITSESLPDCSPGSEYNAALEATGGTSPYTWTISDGALPKRLKLNRRRA